MANKKTARRALFTSVISLIICCCMLVGTTFAWFTDSVTSANNKIQSGTLKIDLELLDKESDIWASIKEESKPIFSYELWEPGYVDVKILKIENEGNLALKWYAKFQAAAELSILADVIDVYVCPSATEIDYPANRNLDGYTKVGTLAEFVNTIESTTNGSLMPEGEAGSIAYLGIALKMQESAGNEYQNLDLGGAFDIMILATQETYEKDSFDDQYDVDADYGVFTAVMPLNAGESAVDVEIRNNDGYKEASVLVPAEAVAKDAEGKGSVNVIVNNNAPYAAITVEADKDVKGFDVKVQGLVENNTTPITVQLRIPAGLNPATVKLYHYSNEIPCSYNPKVGDPITFVLNEDLVVATHRVIEIDAENRPFYTKGDANDTADAAPVHFNNVVGVPQFSIPLLGYVSDYFQHPPGLYVAIGLGVVLLAVVFLPDLFTKKNKEEA